MRFADSTLDLREKLLPCARLGKLFEVLGRRNIAAHSRPIRAAIPISVSACWTQLLALFFKTLWGAMVVGNGKQQQGLIGTPKLALLFRCCDAA